MPWLMKTPGASFPMYGDDTVVVDLKNLPVVLRDSSEEDIEYAMDLERRPENAPYVRQWSVDQHRHAIKDSNFAHFMVKGRQDSGIKGFVILIGLDDPDNNLQIKRIVIHEKGKGFGRAVMKAVKHYAFTRVKCHRLWLEVVEGYDRARQLYASEGFSLEGTFRETFKRGDERISLDIMSILAGEWSSA